MAAGKKFGTFAGVFTPSLLTILGVIMYMRMGWVVGNAGLIGTIVIVVIAHVISVTTGLSISSIATDKKIGAGGVYYVLSRSLGLPIGGAIGLTLFAGTALSIALYLVGFAESINSYLGFDTSVNGLRVTGTIALLSLAAIALISTAVALKTQFFILAAIAISLVAIFFGHSEFVPLTVPFFGKEGSASMETVFAIFFPAVTGFTAGIAMSGDLKDSKKSIPAGTIAAIAVGFVVYIVLAVFISYTINADVLVTDNNILMKVALFAPAVVAGIWGATLSSALGGILGGPRILQAMSLDKITPKFFARGKGKDNEPWNALFLTLVIAEMGILIGELDMIARVVSMFYLAAYGVINISFFLESWASADFNPTFRVKRWVGLVGFIATFAVMFKLDMLAMIAAFVVIGGVYAWLQRKELALGTGDIWQSVWSSVVKTGLRKMAAKVDHKRNWKPNVLLFSGATDDRPHLLEFSKSLAGRSGVITNFHLIEDPKAEVLYPKHQQAFSDDVLERFGIFGRRIQVQNVFKGIEGIASTFGFSGVEPNTVMMGWPRNTKDPVWFAEMTQKLVTLDYNVLYLDYDERRGFGKQETVDLWWRRIGDNADLMLNLARFVTTSQDWSDARIRVLYVNDKNEDSKLIRIRINHVLESFRVDAEVVVINNREEKVPFYELMKIHSSEADLILTGIPELAENKVDTFVKDTTELVGVIGTTLLVKASSQFDQTVVVSAEEDDATLVPDPLRTEPLALPSDPVLANAITELDQQLELAATQFRMEALNPVRDSMLRLVDRTGAVLIGIHDKANDPLLLRPLDAFGRGAEELGTVYKEMHKSEEKALHEMLSGGISHYLGARERAFQGIPDQQHMGGSGGKRIPWGKVLRSRASLVGGPGVRFALNEFGLLEMILAIRIASDTAHHFQQAFVAISKADRNELPQELLGLRAKAEALVAEHRLMASAIAERVHASLRKNDHDMLSDVARALDAADLMKQHRALNTRARRKEAFVIAEYNARYADHWLRNNSLLERHIATGYDMMRVGLRIEVLAERMLAQVRTDYLRGVHQHIKRLQAALEEARTQLDKDGLDGIHPEAFQLENELFFSPDQITEQLSEKADDLVSTLPDEVVLLSAGAVNTFAEEQGDGVTTETLALDKVAEHLLETLFINPLQEKLMTLGRQLDRISGQLKGTTDALNDGIGRSKEKKDSALATEALDRCGKELESAGEALVLAWSSFKGELATDRTKLAEALEVRSIIEQAPTLHARIKVESRRQGLQFIGQRISETVGGWVSSVSGVVERRKRRLALARFDQQHKAFENEHERVWDMMAQLTLRKDLVEKVPFHYQHLFSGKHHDISRKLENRQREVELARVALQRIRDGASGGIMVLGESLTGKTFFIDHIAKQLVGWNVVRVNAPIGGATTRKDLSTAFQEATGSNFPLDRLLGMQRAGTAFILNDVEKWWSLEEGGSEALEHLARMIDRHGNRHFFLLNANLHAYGLIKETTSLPASLLANIVLPPMTTRELRHEIWTRHEVGGLDLLLDETAVESAGSMALRSMVRKIHAASKGNIGLALRIWLARVQEVEDNTVTLTAPSTIEFPDLDNGTWKSLLQQFVLYRDLSRSRLHELYREEGKAWTDKQIQSLRRAGILEEISFQVYTLSPASRPFVESWLKELRILN